ncbi:uncharacterized protein LOC128192114 [Crassostrea angulata]|uniref:uncharacterized protein LOC128192114 n=1 Tax=Magallana angulata TaxID=2784310 RepID=UPI0022B11949|nr:uncharacterized protein LOC128192114 [Crassostrea angulata]
MSFLLINCLLLVIKMCNGKADNCSSENNQFPCCANFYWDEGECKECLPGYFGMNCQSRCFYPTFGKLCMNTCGCNISDCDHVSGCQGNGTEIQITAVNTRSWVSLSVNPNFPWSYSSAATPDYSTEKEELYNDRGLKTRNLKMPIIIVGCVVLLLILVNGIKWISKPVKKAHIITNTMEDNDLPSIYTEIDERSEQEYESNTMRTNVTSTSFTSLNGIETRRPQLPARNTQLNFC